MCRSNNLKSDLVDNMILYTLGENLIITIKLHKLTLMDLNNRVSIIYNYTKI